MRAALVVALLLFSIALGLAPEDLPSDIRLGLNLPLKSDGFAAFQPENPMESVPVEADVSSDRPSPRWFHAAAYDSHSNRVIMFGGLSGELDSNDTWAYDVKSETWTNKNPAASPSARHGHSMVYDVQSDQIVLFGGVVERRADSDETWAYDFETNAWTNMRPAVKPSPRSGSAMAYDFQSDRVVLFGGGEVLGDAWAYDLDTNTWTRMDPATPPTARRQSAMAYDSSSDRAVLFGGFGNDGYSDETWVYDFETNTWTNMNPAARPSPRNMHALAYDSQSDRVVLFGGLTDPIAVQNGETWTYDLETNTWTNMNPAARPSARNMHALAYDSQSDRVVLFGGFDGVTRELNDETWIYDLDANTWNQVQFVPSAPPILRATPGDAQVFLWWLTPSNGGSPIVGYRIYRGTSSGSASPYASVGVVNTYRDTGVTNGVTYYYRMSAVNALGEGPLSPEANATPVAQLQLSVSGVPTAGVAPLAVSFTTIVSGGLGPYSYAWSFGDGGTGSEPNPTYTYLIAGTYEASVVVTDALGTQRSSTLSIQVLTPLVLDFSADATSGVVPFALSFRASASGGTPPYWFLWDFGDGSTSTQQDPSHTYEVAGTYTVTLTVTDAADRTVTKTVQVTASPPPVAGLGLVVYAAVLAVGLVLVGVLLWRRRPRFRMPPGRSSG